MDVMIALTGTKLPQGEAPAWSAARTWDSLRGVYRASLGEDDPRVRCALSRAARALSLDPESLGPAAAMAAGAAELFARASAGACGGGRGPGPWPRAREEKFALDVLEATRAELARTPGREKDALFPAPAFRLGTALYPGPANPAPVRPGPGELRSALSAAERDGAGSAEALSARSRLGGALSDAEAWERASVTTLLSGSRPAAGDSGGSPASGTSGTSGDSGGCGDSGAPADASRGESALGLLRSASVGLDALLGRAHPDSLEARERLARHLAGLSGPGLPPDALAGERPPDTDIREAMDIFLETAAARAGAASRTGPAPARDAGSRGISPDTEREAVLIRHTSDERALAAAAAAGMCSLLLRTTPEQARFLEAANLAAMDTLDPKGSDDTDHPAVLQFMTLACERLYLEDNYETASQALRLVNIRQKKLFGASARETVGTSIRLGTAQFAVFDLGGSLDSYAEALEAAEEAFAPGTTYAADAARGPGLPPGRAGRDILHASTHLANCLCTAQSPRHALGVLGPFLDALPRLPPVRDPEGAWPWPPELAGRALSVAGEAAAAMGDDAAGESLLRRSLDLMGPEAVDYACQAAALKMLADILAKRGGWDRLREAADLGERQAGVLFRREGPDSSDALDALARAAELREAAGGGGASLVLHRRLLAARTRLLGPADESTRESRENVSRLERKLGGKKG
jgi:hypothetical protein